MDVSTTAIIRPLGEGTLFDLSPSYIVLQCPPNKLPQPDLSSVLSVYTDSFLIRCNPFCYLYHFDSPSGTYWVFDAHLSREWVSPSTDPSFTLVGKTPSIITFRDSFLFRLRFDLTKKTLESITDLFGHPLGQGVLHFASLCPRRSPASIRWLSPTHFQVWVAADIEPSHASRLVRWSHLAQGPLFNE